MGNNTPDNPTIGLKGNEFNGGDIGNRFMLDEE
jgi:hypothetical protein